ncbi:MAG: hypothetical protein ACYC3I_24500, partial [Gemmataceae bacterium]
TVWRERGYATLDAARNQMANDALAQGFDELRHPPHPQPPSPPPPLPPGARGGNPSPLAPEGRGVGGEGRGPPPRDSLHETIEPLPDSFPRFKAYFVSYHANLESLRQTLEWFRHSDWSEVPGVFVEPEDWPVGMPSASRNYKRALEAAIEDGCDFAVLLEDDVRVCRHLRFNLRSLRCCGATSAIISVCSCPI